MADVVTLSDGTLISSLIQNYLDKKWLERMEANLCYDKFGEQRPCPDGNGGVVWHQMLNVGTGYDLGEGVPPAASAISTRKVSATPTQRADLKAISDLLDIESGLPIIAELVSNMGYGAALDKDSQIADQIGLDSNPSTGVADAASAFVPSVHTRGFPLFSGSLASACFSTYGLTSYATLSSIPTLAHVRKCVTHLRKLDAIPFEDGLFRGVVHPVVSDYLRQDTNFSTWLAHSQPDAMRKGQLGNVEGVSFEESSKAMTTVLKASAWSGNTSAGGTIYGTLIFGKGAYGVTKIGSDAKVTVISGPDKADPLNQKTYVGYKYTMAAKVLNPSAGVILAYCEMA